MKMNARDHLFDDKYFLWCSICPTQVDFILPRNFHNDLVGLINFWTAILKKTGGWIHRFFLNNSWDCQFCIGDNMIVDKHLTTIVAIFYNKKRIFFEDCILDADHFEVKVCKITRIAWSERSSLLSKKSMFYYWKHTILRNIVSMRCPNWIMCILDRFCL
jgi:hypothetical protein